MSLDALLAACASLSDADVLELKSRMDNLSAERRGAAQTAAKAEEEKFKRDQKIRLKAMARGGGAKKRGGGGSDEEGAETAEEKAAR